MKDKQSYKMAFARSSSATDQFPLFTGEGLRGGASIVGRLLKSGGSSKMSCCIVIESCSDGETWLMFGGYLQGELEAIEKTRRIGYTQHTKMLLSTAGIRTRGEKVYWRIQVASSCSSWCALVWEINVALQQTWWTVTKDPSLTLSFSIMAPLYTYI